MTPIWQWVDETVNSQIDRRVNVQVATLSAELWHGRGTNKRDRPVKRIRRNNFIDFEALKDLANSVDCNTSENGVSMTLWFGHYDMSPGFLLQLRRQAHNWRKDYKGLTEEDFDQIMEYRRTAQERRRSNPLRDSPEAVLRELWPTVTR